MPDSHGHGSRLATLLIGWIISLPISAQTPSPLENRQVPHSCGETLSVLRWSVDNTGAVDMTAQIQAAIDSGESLFFPSGKYRIEHALHFHLDHATYCFDPGSSFIRSASVSTSSFFDIAGSDVLLSGFTIAGGNKAAGPYAVRLLAGAHNVSLEKCTIKNLKGSGAVTRQYGLFVDLEGTGGFRVVDCLFEDIYQVDEDGPGSTLAFCGGIYLGHSGGALAAGTTGEITRCVFQDMRSVLAATQTKYTTDADAIRFEYSGAPTYASRNLGIVVSGNTFLNIEKRGVKISGVGGVVFDDNTVLNNIVYAPECSAKSGHAGIELLFDASDITIRGLTVSGNVVRGVWIQNGPCIVEGLRHNYRRDGTPNLAGVYAVRAVRVPDAPVGPILSLSLRDLHARDSAGLELVNVHNSVCDVVTVSSPASPIYTPFKLEECSNVALQHLVNDDTGGHVAKSCWINNCTNIELRDVKLEGSGCPMFLIHEDPGAVTSDITIEDFVLAQVGYESSVIDAITVEIASGNNGFPTDGVDRVAMRRGHIVIAEQIASLTMATTNGQGVAVQDQGVTVESSELIVDDLTVEYTAQGLYSLADLVRFSGCNDGQVSGLRIISPASTRCVNVLATGDLTLSNIVTDVPMSFLTIQLGSTGIVLGDLRAREGFALPIVGLANSPSILLFD